MPLEIDLSDITEQKQILSHFQSIETEDAELKQLRQQILQEAIEGKLTAVWRADNPDIEPASELLARIPVKWLRNFFSYRNEKPTPFEKIIGKNKDYLLI